MLKGSSYQNSGHDNVWINNTHNKSSSTTSGVECITCQTVTT